MSQFSRKARRKTLEATVSLTSVPHKIMEKTVLGVIEKHLKDN